MHRMIKVCTALLSKSYEMVITEEKIPLLESITKNYELWLMVTEGLIVFFILLGIVLVCRNFFRRNGESD